MTKWILYYEVQIDDQEKDISGVNHTIDEWQKLIAMFMEIPCHKDNFKLTERRIQR